ncbi:hypothetical protein [Pontibacter sp. H249]|uniref:hypothetical protein n=1 Tax=Pontibacter sp. H249 TaxID=3133420 RepID=UPI0030BFCD8A
MHKPEAIATTLTLPNSIGQLLLSVAFSYCLSVYGYAGYYYSYYYRRTYCALFGNHTDNNS